MQLRPLVLAFALSACGSGVTSSDPSSGGWNGETFGPLPAGCSPGSQLVYVLSEDGGLYDFDPGSLAFHRIGTLGCGAVAGSPNSMAVDRHARAWVGYYDGTLFEVSTRDASCAATEFEPGQHGFGRFGMGFASDGDAQNETLFVCDMNGHGLGAIDLDTLALSPIGNFSGALAGTGCELAGTGDGHLYGFFMGDPATLASVDPATAATRSATQLWGVDTGTDWAFTFWGGDFYLYWADDGSNTHVSRYRPADGTIRTVLDDVGFRVVGAGVSSCAPTKPPAPTK